MLVILIRRESAIPEMRAENIFDRGFRKLLEGLFSIFEARRLSVMRDFLMLVA